MERSENFDEAIFSEARPSAQSFLSEAVLSVAKTAAKPAIEPSEDSGEAILSEAKTSPKPF